MTKKELRDIKKTVLLSSLTLLITASYSGYTQSLYSKTPKKIEITQEDIEESTHAPSLVVLKQDEQKEEFERLARNRVSSHQENIKPLEKIPIIEKYEEHHMPTLDQIIAYIKEKRHISDKDFETFINDVILASQEYSISYTREQAIKVWYLVTVTSRETKEQYVLKRWGMLENELAISEACATAEAKRTSQNTGDYVDSFTLTDTAIVRTKDKGYSKTGGDVYDQFTMSGQFAVYSGGYYKKYIGIANDGCLDALYAYAYTKDLGLTPFRTRWFKEFRSANSSMSNPFQMVAKGNKYDANKIVPVWKTIDSYQPYNALTDDFYHQIMDERELCHIDKYERVIGYKYNY